jgi:hypothetical protein
MFLRHQKKSENENFPVFCNKKKRLKYRYRFSEIQKKLPLSKKNK